MSPKDMTVEQNVEGTLPSMRTFRVIVDGDLEPIFVDAHSVTCKSDAAHFYVWRNEMGIMLAFVTRVLRPYLEVEDVTANIPRTLGRAN